MLKRAWAAHCSRTRTPRNDEIAYDRWYRAELHKCLGIYTTKQANRKGDFEKAMAHFEEIAGDSIEWQLKYYSGDARRVLHSIREICAEHDIDETYMRGVARLALSHPDPDAPVRSREEIESFDSLPDVSSLKVAQLIKVKQALKSYISRELKKEVA
jgi:hypothetical protein